MAIEANDTELGVPGHLLHAYATEADLARVVGPYLAEALRSDGAAVVVADAAHRRAIETEMLRTGVDVVASGRHHAYRSLDAALTLSAFYDGYRMDTEAFDATVGSVVRDAVDAGRPVRVYGEMVALLWVAGDVEGCLTLETMWNDLARRLPFSLLCAYPATTDGPSRFSDPVSRVFHLHSALVPQPRPIPPRTGGDDEQLTQRFEAQLDAPWAARRFLFQSLQRWGLGGLSDDAAVVLTELVTNAIVHTSAPFTVVLRSLGDSVRLEVTDASPLPPARRNNPAAGPLAQSGRGLALVAALATSWGWEPVGGGKVVWADVGP